MDGILVFRLSQLLGYLLVAGFAFWWAYRKVRKEFPEQSKLQTVLWVAVAGAIFGTVAWLIKAAMRYGVD